MSKKKKDEAVEAAEERLKKLPPNRLRKNSPKKKTKQPKK